LLREDVLKLPLVNITKIMPSGCRLAGEFVNPPGAIGTPSGRTSADLAKLDHLVSTRWTGVESIGDQGGGTPNCLGSCLHRGWRC